MTSVDADEIADMCRRRQETIEEMWARSVVECETMPFEGLSDEQVRD